MVRRNFLKYVAIGSVSFSCKSKIKPKIAILGGGLAGLTVAYYLKKANVNVEVFEANNRIGGRVITGRNIVAQGITTELGGEFIDSSHKEILTVCKEFNLSFLDMESSSEKGLIKTDFFIAGIRRTKTDIIEEVKHYPNLLKDIQQIKKNNFKRYHELDKLSIDQYFSSINLTGWLSILLKKAYTSELGLDSSEQNCINMLNMLNIDIEKNEFEMYGSSDERYKVIGGNERIIEEYAKRLEYNINTDFVVEKVAEYGKSYKVFFQNGKTIVADILVMTMPFSVLKDIKIDLKMSPLKRKCINELGYGTQSKMLFGFNERFWRDYNFAGYVLSDNIHNGWDSSQMQLNNKGIGSYTIFMGGQKGKELQVDQYKFFLSELDKIYPNAKSNYLQHNVYNWYQNPYSKGAYSCYKVGQMTTIAGYEGQAIGNVFFAGEHCSTNFQGFMQGAVETGLKVAEEILNICY